MLTNIDSESLEYLVSAKDCMEVTRNHRDPSDYNLPDWGN